MRSTSSSPVSSVQARCTFFYKTHFNMMVSLCTSLYSPKASAGCRVPGACALQAAGSCGVAGSFVVGGGVRVRDRGRWSGQGALSLCGGLGVADLLCPCCPCPCPPVLLSPKPHPPLRPRFLRQVFFLVHDASKTQIGRAHV
jgi:hypothetical protein